MRFLVRYQSAENCSSRLINSDLAVHVCPSLYMCSGRSHPGGDGGALVMSSVLYSQTTLAALFTVLRTVHRMHFKVTHNSVHSGGAVV